MNKVMELMNQCGIVPVVVIDDVNDAVDTAKALLEGGVGVMEITLRTEAGLGSISKVAKECPDMLVGAGTVLSLDQCKQAIENGAKFIVSPGFDPEVVDYCIEKDVAVCPGCVTPTEITAAINKGLKIIKFFPANIYGGLKALKALGGPFTDIRFIPTGGASLDNLADYNDPKVYAVGGSWLCDRKDIQKGNFANIVDVCYKSIDVLVGLKDESGNEVAIKDLLVNGGIVTTINEDKFAYQLNLRGFSSKDGKYTKDGLIIQVK